MKINVSLVSVTCLNPESVLSGDNFYVMGGAIAGGKSQPFITKPMNIKSGETLVFPGDQRVVFKGDVPEGSTISLALSAYDEETTKDWDRLWGPLQNKLADELSELVPVIGAKAKPVSDKTLDVFTKFWELMDPDDHLGTMMWDLPVEQCRPGKQVWELKDSRKRMGESAAEGWSDWDYTVKYEVSVKR